MFKLEIPPDVNKKKEEMPEITHEKWQEYADVDGNNLEGAEKITNFAKEKGIELDKGFVKINVDGKVLELDTDVEDFFTQKY